MVALDNRWFLRSLGRWEMTRLELNGEYVILCKN